MCLSLSLNSGDSKPDHIAAPRGASFQGLPTLPLEARTGFCGSAGGCCSRAQSLLLSSPKRSAGSPAGTAQVLRCPWVWHLRASCPGREAIALEEHRGNYCCWGWGDRRLPGADVEGFSGQMETPPALLPRGNLHFYPPRCGPGHCRGHAKSEEGLCRSAPRAAVPLPAPNSLQWCETDPGQLHPVSPPRLTPTHVGPGGASLRTRRAGAGSDRQASTAAWAGGYLPVSFVVHGNEIHEKHVVSHGVHAEYLHLEGGEHAPGTEGERRVEPGSRGEPRRAIAGTAPSPAQGCSGPGVGAPEPWRPCPFNFPGILPLTVSGPLAGATGQSGRKTQTRQRSVRARAAVFAGP